MLNVHKARKDLPSHPLLKNDYFFKIYFFWNCLELKEEEILKVRGFERQIFLDNFEHFFFLKMDKKFIKHLE